MDIKFSCFRFNTTQQLLYKNDKLIPLKRNQGLLLGFFLNSTESIHSKGDILDAVWKDKDVSEQVVFQTISQLRQLISPACIRTFSKKGYKWQMPIIKSNVEQPLKSTHLPPPHSVKHAKGKILSLTALIFVLAILFLANNSDKGTVITLPSATDQARNNPFNVLIKEALEASSLFEHAQGNMVVYPRQAFVSPELVAPDNGSTQWQVWGETFQSHKGIFAQYGLKKNAITWQGYVYGESEQTLQKNLTAAFETLNQMGLFSLTSNEADFADIREMHNRAPDNLDVTLRLAEHYLNTNQQDIALTYLQDIIDSADSYGQVPYKAQALWYKGKIYKMRSQHYQATNNLVLMSETLADTPLWSLNYQNIQTRAWLAFEEGSIEEMFNVLDQGLGLAKIQADPLSLFEFHILYSTLAHKTSHTQLKFDHLNQAQALLFAHELDTSNFASVYFHFALFSQDNDKAPPYLHKVLTLARTSQNYWIQNSALEMLVNHHIAQHAFTDAHELFRKPIPGIIPSAPQSIYLQARIHQTQGQPKQAHALFKQAFHQANLNFDRRTAIESAHALFNLSVHNPISQSEYLAFLQSNAHESWLEQNLTNVASQ